MLGEKSISNLPSILKKRRISGAGGALFILDEFFKKNKVFALDLEKSDQVIFVETSKKEPTTDYVNQLHDSVKNNGPSHPCAIVGIGGGSTLDIAKAISNLLTNGGRAEDYQGWDLVENPGIFKIGVPTLSGSGSEATRTCVMTNPRNGLKLGMNSDHTVFDQIILDPGLTATVPRDQYFWTGMDAYIHCIESLSGSHRNAIGDALSFQTLSLCKQVFYSENMKTLENREKLMVASYLGGNAIATSYVGMVHPFSAGLSVVLGTHHCVGNCIVMRAMEEFYPGEFEEFWKMVAVQNIKIPDNLCKNLSDEKFEQLYNATIIHEKPLKNALGEDFKNILTREKVREIFEKM